MSDERNTVWAVTSGEYSDFGVVAVFESEEEARAAVNDGMGDDCQELDYYATGVSPRKTAEAIYLCFLDRESGAMLDNHSPRKPVPDFQVSPTVLVHRAHPSNRAPSRQPSALVVPGPRASWHVQMSGPADDRTRKAFHDLVAKTRAEIAEGLR